MCEAGHDDIIERLESLEEAFREYNGELGNTQKDVALIRKDVTLIKKYIVGDLEEKNEPGLAERVRNIENWIGDQKKMYYLVISVFITQIIGWIFVLIIR